MMQRTVHCEQPYATDAGLAGITGSPTRIGGPERRAAAARRMGLCIVKIGCRPNLLSDVS
jgi:hypothetical protein